LERRKHAAAVRAEITLLQAAEDFGAINNSLAKACAHWGWIGFAVPDAAAKEA
jgi:hypothetical protein